jgi:poly-gamma-glutamate capsule biosynthesis protein CapA/YwtB (metallophosphatase superfamily)
MSDPWWMIRAGSRSDRAGGWGVRDASRVAATCVVLAVCLAFVLPGVPVAGAGRVPVAFAEDTTVSPTPDPTATPEPTVTVVPTITVAAVGDLLFDSAPKRLIQAHGGKAPFSAVASHLRTADVTLGNLECPLSKRGRAVPNKAFTFRGDPRAVQGLTWAGFDLLSLANNHARDYGAAALRDTFSTLKKAGIAFAGAGANRTAAWKPAIIERGGARIAFLGFSEIGPSSFVATGRTPGTAYTMSRSKVVKAIKAAHKKADYVIVSFHWGVERDYSPTSRQVADGRAAVRAGADMVLSSHPHVLQGVEFYRHRLIAYSLGNFVFSPGSDAGRDTMILHATMTPKGVSEVSAEPVHIGQDGRPRLQKGKSASRILRIVKRTSTRRGTHVHVSGSHARLTP